jgi:site-specific recombinase XerD
VRDCNLINEFADFLRYGKHRAERTIESYRSDIEQFLDFLRAGTADKRDVCSSSESRQSYASDHVSSLENVSSDKVRAFMNYLQNRKYNRASIRRKLATLICFYKFLHSEKLIDFNPTLNIKAAKIEKHKPKILTDEQTWKLLHLPNVDTWLGARDRAMLELLCFTGIRVSELTNLNVDSFDIDRYQLRIISHSGKMRCVRLTATVVESIRRYLNLRTESILNYEEEQDSKALFVNKFGRRIDTRSADRRIEKYIQKADFRETISPYDLRHSYAKKLIENGIDIKQMGIMLGFESASAARLYVDAIKSGDMKLQQTFFK